MKKLLLAVATFGLLLTSCQNDLDIDKVGGETAQLTISVGTPQGTRAYAEGTNATLLQYAVYDEEGDILDALTVEEGEINNGSAEVTLTLAANNTYSVLFWAQNEDAPYEVDFDKKTLTINYTGVESNNDALDAFYCYKKIQVATGAQSETIKLTRPFAQLNIGTNDFDKATAAGYTPNKSTVTVKNLASKLNLATGETVVDKQAVTFDYAAIPTGEDFPVDNYDYLAMNYVLVGNDVENVEVAFNYTDGYTEGKLRTVSYVPVQRNHRTNIYGSILTTDVNVRVDIEGEPIEPDHNVDRVDGALVDINGNLVSGETPTATINKLEAPVLDNSDDDSNNNYSVVNGTLSGTPTLPFVMEFVADQTEDDMATCPYADWYADFVLTFTGIEGDSFTADGCYLAGNYGDFGWWIIPVDGLEIESGARYPIMIGFGAGQKYDYICTDVKNFKCALYLTPEILAANPDIEVTLELSLVGNLKGEDAARTAFEDPAKTYVNVIAENTYTANDFNSNITVTTADELTEKIANATTDITIYLGDDITGTATAVQKEGVKVSIIGNGHKYDGSIIVDGQSKGYDTASLLIQDINFTGNTVSTDAYINLGNGNDNTRYTRNVTVKGCTFTTTATEDVAAIKSYTGGDKNLNVKGCTVDETMHSLLQLQNIEQGLVIEGCTVSSKNGINLNSTPTFAMSNCSFNTRGYAIRVGVNGSVNTEKKKTFNVSNSTLKSACEDGDAVIIFRDNATFAELTLNTTTVEGTTKVSGNTSSTTIVGL